MEGGEYRQNEYGSSQPESPLEKGASLDGVLDPFRKEGDPDYDSVAPEVDYTQFPHLDD